MNGKIYIYNEMKKQNILEEISALITEDEIIINSTLEYTGLQPLDIVGSGQSIKTTQNQTLLFVSNGADLTISNLNFYGVGGFSIKKGGLLCLKVTLLVEHFG